MNSWLRHLVFLVFSATAMVPLRAQVPVATFTCSGNGQPTLSMAAYAFDFQVATHAYGQYGFAIVASSEAPTLLAAAASGAVYDSCSIGDGTDSLPITQVGIANASFGEYGAGVGTPDSLSYGLVQVIYVSDQPSSQHASTHSTYRSVSPLNRQLDELISRARAAH